jgi:diphthamide synthase (EF-2-diphthine--ammonia ligase)
VHEVWIPQACINPVYESRMGDAIAELKAAGVQSVAFGDLFLEDVRAYREKQMAPTGLECAFPIWGEDTSELARWMTGNLKASLVCVDPNQIPAELAGREHDASLLAVLPASADPCGERGEFHTFVRDAPNFSAPIAVEHGERVEREGFWFADLLPSPVTASQTL